MVKPSPTPLYVWGGDYPKPLYYTKGNSRTYPTLNTSDQTSSITTG